MPGRFHGQKAVLARMGNFFSSGWFVEGDETSNASRRALVMHNVTANVSANLIGGNFFTGLLIILQADDAFIGLVNILVFSANLLQLFTPMLLERFDRRKTMLIVVRVIIHLINIVFTGLIPFMPASTHTRLIFLGFSVLIVNALNAFNAPGFSVWHIAHVPPSVRVQYFSVVSMLNGIFVAVFNLIGSGVVDHFKSAGAELTGLTVLRVAALIISIYDIWLLTRIKELPPAPHTRINLKSLFTEPINHPVYLRTALIAVLWSLVVNMPGSFYSVYLLKELQVSYSYLNLIASLNVVVLVLLTFVWRKVYLKHNWLKPLGIAVLALAPHYAVLAFVSDGLLFLYPIGVIWSFICSSAINLGFTNLSFINIPRENQTLYVGFYSTANSLAALAAASLARAFVTRLQGLRFTLLGVPFGEKQLLMLVVGALMVGVGFVILRIARVNKLQGLEH
ncbi:MAG: MFS transporter [Bacillota bacterium]|nr:MFS transporter [Bacillota bacterium]